MGNPSEGCSAAILLAGGRGRRMHSVTAKQYLLLDGKPILYYSLKAFQQSAVEDIVLVTGRGEDEYVRKEIVEKYGFTKVRALVEGGRERYHSVWNGLRAVLELSRAEGTSGKKNLPSYIFVQDGARPFVTVEMIENAWRCVAQTGACVVGMPAKDTVKIVDTNENIVETPARNLVWTAQTPQVFAWDLIYSAYEKLICEEDELLARGIRITDDAGVVELFTGRKVRLVRGSYENIKITTPEDLEVAETFLKKRLIDFKN